MSDWPMYGPSRIVICTNNARFYHVQTVINCLLCSHILLETWDIKTKIRHLVVKCLLYARKTARNLALYASLLLSNINDAVKRDRQISAHLLLLTNLVFAIWFRLSCHTSSITGGTWYNDKIISDWPREKEATLHDIQTWWQWRFRLNTFLQERCSNIFYSRQVFHS